MKKVIANFKIEEQDWNLFHINCRKEGMRASGALRRFIITFNKGADDDERSHLLKH